METDALDVPPHLFALVRKGPLPRWGEGNTFSGCVWGVVAKALLWVSAYAGMTVRPFERLRGAHNMRSPPQHPAARGGRGWYAWLVEADALKIPLS